MNTSLTHTERIAVAVELISKAAYQLIIESRFPDFSEDSEPFLPKRTNAAEQRYGTDFIYDFSRDQTYKPRKFRIWLYANEKTWAVQYYSLDKLKSELTESDAWLEISDSVREMTLPHGMRLDICHIRPPESTTDRSLAVIEATILFPIPTQD